jgi:two-component system, OmpR family, sensor kinase
MIKSLRLRLQLFHAIILTAAVVLFGVAFYRQLHRSTMGEIDAELLSGARVLEGTIRGMPPRVGDEFLRRIPLELPPAMYRRPPPPGQDRVDFPARDQAPRGDFDSPPRDLRRDRTPRRFTGAGSQVESRPQTTEDSPDFRPDDGQRFRPPMSPAYFAIFADEGKLLRQSEASNVAVGWTLTQRPLEFRNVEERREVLLRGPRGTLIVVGRDVGLEMQRLTAALVQLFLIGTGVLCLGLIGGWWLAGNAIRPIQQISQTAEGINARNLAERIDTVSMDSELQSLGTTLNSMLARIESAFDKQCQFTADASHDLRTPLAVLLSHCELALSRPRSPEEYQATLGTCLSAAGRMKSLVDGLLLLARSDAGELELQRTSTDLRDLATEAIELFRPYAAEHHVELKLAGEVAPCLADRQAISQVIANLLDNAILYNRAGGLVTLSTYCASGWACLQVQDTGPGIPGDALPKIFDRFYRVDEARIRRNAIAGQSGSGLGLSICKSIVEAHGGELSVSSTLTVGSLFEVRLPSSIEAQAARDGEPEMVESIAPPPITPDQLNPSD